MIVISRFSPLALFLCRFAVDASAPSTYEYTSIVASEPTREQSVFKLLMSRPKDRQSADTRLTAAVVPSGRRKMPPDSETSAQTSTGAEGVLRLKQPRTVN